MNEGRRERETNNDDSDKDNDDDDDDDVDDDVDDDILAAFYSLVILALLLANVLFIHLQTVHCLRRNNSVYSHIQ